MPHVCPHCLRRFSNRRALLDHVQLCKAPKPRQEGGEGNGFMAVG